MLSYKGNSQEEVIPVFLTKVYLPQIMVTVLLWDNQKLLLKGDNAFFPP